MLKKLIATIALSIATAGLASADEVFKTWTIDDNDPRPDLFYEIDLGDVAVWTFEDRAARFYIKGLAGVYPGRTQYTGHYVLYRTDDEGPGCAAGPIADHEGKQVTHWGSLEIRFPADDEFVLTVGKCDGPIENGAGIRGKW